ncbi:hypothetical protein Dda_8195 [Drechslerella dactyloides]|uniref:Peptidase A1 domain-containing protein n=1 Tax=Drechslerella dactyloides TaxID=74499 RepID=A0AAD6NFA4_DREDA|nr:hypothetical protein Dda_8195 [Drechslerella dactyloides]
MRRRTLLTSITAISLLPFTLGDFPGKDRSNGIGPGALVESVNTAVSSAGPAQPASTAQAATGQCGDGVKRIGLSRDGPYLPVTVNKQTFNLAIALDVEETFIFSSEFCKMASVTDSRCLVDDDIENDDIKAVTVTTGTSEYKLNYSKISSTVLVGNLQDNIVLDDFDIAVVIGMDGLNIQGLAQLIGSNIHGIIGLKNSSELIQRLAKECNQPAGFGINLQANSFLAFGGLDVSGSNIGSYNSSSIIEKQLSYESVQFESNNTGRNGINGPFRKRLVFDSTSPFNIIPSDLLDQWKNLGLTAPITLTIGNVVFTAPWQTFVSNSQPTGTGEVDTVILGAPFFQYVYVASIPGYANQALVYTPHDGSNSGRFESFEQIAGGGTSTKTGADATSAPKPSGSSNANINDSDTNAQPSSAPVRKSNNNVGAIVGGVIGGVIGLLLIIAGACFFVRRRRKQKPYQSRGMVKEYGGPEFDPVVGSPDTGIFPHFSKEAGYASLPKPPPAPAPQITTIGIGSAYESQTEYTPTLQAYHDESPSRSLSATPSQSQTPSISLPPQRTSSDNRRLSAAPSLTIEPPSPLSRNVSAASRRGYPGISQMQDRSMPHSMPEEDDDDYDVVSMASGPTYDPIHTSGAAASSAPRLPFARNDTDRSAGL